MLVKTARPGSSCSISSFGFGAASAGPDPHKVGDPDPQTRAGKLGAVIKSKKELILPSPPNNGMRSWSHTDKLVFERGTKYTSKSTRSGWLFQVEKGHTLWLVEQVEHKVK